MYLKDFSMKHISTFLITSLLLSSAIHAMEQQSYTNEYALTLTAKLVSHLNRTEGEYRLKHEFDLTEKTCGENYCAHYAPLYCKEHQKYTIKNDTLMAAKPMTQHRESEGADNPGPLRTSIWKYMVTAEIVKATTNLDKGIHGMHDITLKYSISRPKTGNIVVPVHQFSLEVPINSDKRVRFWPWVPGFGWGGYTQIPLEFTIKSSLVVLPE